MFNITYLRSFKIWDYAIFDFVTAFIGVYLVSPILTKLFRLINLNIPLSSWLYLTIPLSIFVHIIVGSPTPLTKYFLDPSGHYFLKLSVVALTYLSISGMKIIR